MSSQKSPNTKKTPVKIKRLAKKKREMGPSLGNQFQYRLEWGIRGI